MSTELFSLSGRNVLITGAGGVIGVETAARANPDGYTLLFASGTFLINQLLYKVPYEALRDHVAFYAAPLDECTVDGVQVVPQPGGFYGGWITPELVGPFKGVPGSYGW